MTAHSQNMQRRATTWLAAGLAAWLTGCSPGSGGLSKSGPGVLFFPASVTMLPRLNLWPGVHCLLCHNFHQVAHLIYLIYFVMFVYLILPYYILHANDSLTLKEVLAIMLFCI